MSAYDVYISSYVPYCQRLNIKPMTYELWATRNWVQQWVTQ